MTVHLVKMCVGVESVRHLAALQKARLDRAREAGERPVLRHITRNRPRRAEELCEDGSLYWVVRGFIAVRQRVLDCEESEKADGHRACGLVLDPKLVRTELRPCRPFQGWRYLTPDKAPPDVEGRVDGSSDLPPEMIAELRSLGLL
ncbi:MAG: DUF1489 domain-containing protein [Rhodospirillales bacterium]|nr:DUF1489 domain-containing protein [Rhodospirillales bacterium]